MLKRKCRLFVAGAVAISSSTAVFRIHMLGASSIEGPEGPLAGRGVQRARIALLALLVAAPRHSVSRERAMAILYPESDPERARASLRDSVYRLREALGDRVLATVGDEIRIETSQIQCDVCDFEDAFRRGELRLADQLYTGPFLDGFFIHNSTEFQRWVDSERARLESVHAEVLERFARQCSDSGDLLAAAHLWRRRASADPYNSRVAVCLIDALDAAGDRAGALQQGKIYSTLMQNEFDAEPDSSVVAAIERLRRPAQQRIARQPRKQVDQTGDMIAPAHVSHLRMELASLEGIPGQPTERSRPARRPVLTFGVVALVGMIAVLAAAGVWERRFATDVHDNLRDDLVAVFPFRVTASDSIYGYLRDATVDLIAGQFTGRGLPRAVDTRAVIAASERTTRAANERDLTADEARNLGRGFHARAIIIGEFVATPKGKTISARMLSTASGKVLAEHTESGSGDELILIRRMTNRLLAKSLGESADISGLSDSTEAVRAYLAGMHAYRTGSVALAVNEFGNALRIDSTFVAAALWRAYASWGASVFGSQAKLTADSLAWTLRAHVGRSDSLILASLPSIGPNWPKPATAVELIGAVDRAARANPDRPEGWRALGRILRAWGQQAGVNDYLRQAATAVDSAIALDSTFEPALADRVIIAAYLHDANAVSKFAKRHSVANADGDRAALIEWLAARSVGDTARSDAALNRLAATPSNTWGNVELWAVFPGISSLDEAEQVAKSQYVQSASMSAERARAVASLFRIAALRGRPTVARRYLEAEDSSQTNTDLILWPHADLILYSLVDPAYEREALDAVRSLELSLETERPGDHTADDLCVTQLWRIMHGDTTNARMAVSRMRKIVRSVDAAPAWRVGRLELCPILIEAGVAQLRSNIRSAQLTKLEALLLKGTMSETPGNYAYFLAAKWLEAGGEQRAALSMIHHMDPASNWLVGPVAFRMQGRIASTLGYRSEAIGAYERLLALRPNPEPGPMADDIHNVRMELANLKLH